jgi:hypothetical protein
VRKSITKQHVGRYREVGFRISRLRIGNVGWLGIRNVGRLRKRRLGLGKLRWLRRVWVRWFRLLRRGRLSIR